MVSEGVVPVTGLAPEGAASELGAGGTTMRSCGGAVGWCAHAPKSSAMPAINRTRNDHSVIFQGPHESLASGTCLSRLAARRKPRTARAGGRRHALLPPHVRRHLRSARTD